VATAGMSSSESDSELLSIIIFSFDFTIQTLAALTIVVEIQ
jgi:hypothetical protein